MFRIALFLSLVLALGVSVAAADRPLRLVAHRGGSLEQDENTIAAFRRSYDKGLRGFETDVQMTSDGQLMILHDDTLDRTTTGKGALTTMTAETVRSLRTKKTGEPVPFLADLIAFIKERPDVFFELEMKTNPKGYSDERLEEYCRKLHAAIKGVLPDGTYSCSSFDKRALRIVRRLDAAAPITLIVGGVPEAKHIQEALDLGCSRIDLSFDALSRRLVREAKKAGLEVTGWTATSEQDLALAQALGIDGLTTDIPARLQELLNRSGK